MANEPENYASYKGRKVMVVRPATAGDVGYDPHRDDLVCIRFVDTPPEQDEPDIIVSRSEVTPL